MACLILYGNNANYVGESLSAQRATVAAYQCIRFTQLSFFALYSVASHHHRTQNRIYAGLTFVALLIWIPIYFESVSDRAKIAVAALAIVWEELAYVVGFSPFVANRLNLEFTTAVDIGHENDRYTAFTIIVLGEFTYTILVGLVDKCENLGSSVFANQQQLSRNRWLKSQSPPRYLDSRHRILFQQHVRLH